MTLNFSAPLTMIIGSQSYKFFSWTYIQNSVVQNITSNSILVAPAASGSYNATYTRVGSITVGSKDLSNNNITGYYVELRNSTNNSLIKSGFTTVTFDQLKAGSYNVIATSSYCDKNSGQGVTFNHWTGGSTNVQYTAAVSTTDVPLTAYYSTGPC